MRYTLQKYHEDIRYRMKQWHTKGGFRNPEGSPQFKITLPGSIRYLSTRIMKGPFTEIPSDHVVQNALEQMKSADNPSITWLGHCAFMISIGGIRILTDPFLEGTIGPRILRALRRIPLPFDIQDMPEPDVILISHEHADHLHKPSLKKIKRSNTKAITPIGVGRHMLRTGYGNIRELDLFEQETIGNVRITALPAMHYSSVPGNRTLWAGYKIEAPGLNLYFMGDSGYAPFFARTISKYGPFDYALIGIGSYNLPEPWNKAKIVHTTPEQAVQIAKEISARNIIGMHWGTARMTDEPLNEPKERFEKAAKDFSGNAITLKIGETMQL